jgi:N-glycosylase/DNA lyase
MAMNNLVKREPNEIYFNAENKLIIPHDVPISRRSKELFLSSRNYAKISTYKDMNEVVKNIHSCINQTIMDKGVNISVEEILYLKNRVTDDIMRDFTSYTLEEVKLSFYYGVRGELGEYFGINPTTFYNWLKFFKSQLMPPINQEMQKYMPKPNETKITQQEVDKRIADKLCDVYEKLCNEGTYDYYDLGNIGYNLLDELELLKLSIEEKHVLIAKSREHFKASIEKRNKDLTLIGRTIQRIDLARAFEQLERMNNPTFEWQIKIGAKRLAIHEFMINLSEKKVDLKQMIEEKLSDKKY